MGQVGDIDGKKSSSLFKLIHHLSTADKTDKEISDLKYLHHQWQDRLTECRKNNCPADVEKSLTDQMTKFSNDCDAKLAAAEKADLDFLRQSAEKNIVTYQAFFDRLRSFDLEISSSPESLSAIDILCPLFEDKIKNGCGDEPLYSLTENQNILNPSWAEPCKQGKQEAAIRSK